MQIDKDQIISLLKSQGDHSRAESAQGELPQDVDTEKDAGLLSKLGIDPMDLVKKFAGDSSIGKKLGGLLG